MLTTDVSQREEIAARIDIEPWFFHREGLAYVEHGHQYDPFCATPYVLAPLSPHDPNRVVGSLSDTLLRYIVRRTPGLKEYGHENRGLASYISWALLLGARGTVGLFRRFFAAVFVLRDLARAYGTELGARIREVHEQRLALRARLTGIPVERLREALGLHATPIGRTPRGVLTSVMLDRLAVFAVMVPALFALALLRGSLGGYAVPAVGVLLVVCASLHVWLSRGRPGVDPGVVMADRAGELAKLFPASFVVMGHTHVPMSKDVGDSIYINVGSWAEEEPDPSDKASYRAPRTHLVIVAREGRHEAHLCEWRSDEGPRTLHTLVRPLVDASARESDLDRFESTPRVAS